MIATPLPLETVAKTGYTHKWKITWEDLVAAGGASTTATLTLIASLAAGYQVKAAGYRVPTAFDASDAGINSLTVQVGLTDTDLFLAATQIAVDGTEILYYASFDDASGTTLPYALLAADNLIATFTVAGGASPTHAELTSGEIEIFLGLFDMNKLAGS